MKATWHASVAALGFRLHELGIMSDWHYRRFNIELSRRGRANEPAPLPRETSAVLRKALQVLAEDGIGLREIAKEVAPLDAAHRAPAEDVFRAVLPATGRRGGRSPRARTRRSAEAPCARSRRRPSRRRSRRRRSWRRRRPPAPWTSRASTSTPACASRRATTSGASGSVATAPALRSRSSASAGCPAAASRTGSRRCAAAPRRA